jgi:hypothetical protein
MSLAETAEISSMLLPKGPICGVFTTAQAVPFQRRARVCSTPGESCWVPTAHTLFAAMASIPYRKLAEVPGLGDGTIFQLAPSQCRMSVRKTV